MLPAEHKNIASKSVQKSQANNVITSVIIGHAIATTNPAAPPAKDDAVGPRKEAKILPRKEIKILPKPGESLSSFGKKKQKHKTKPKNVLPNFRRYFAVFRPREAVSRGGLVQSCTCGHCHRHHYRCSWAPSLTSDSSHTRPQTWVGHVKELVTLHAVKQRVRSHTALVIVDTGPFLPWPSQKYRQSNVLHSYISLTVIPNAWLHLTQVVSSSLNWIGCLRDFSSPAGEPRAVALRRMRQGGSSPRGAQSSFQRATARRTGRRGVQVKLATLSSLCGWKLSSLCVFMWNFSSHFCVVTTPLPHYPACWGPLCLRTAASTLKNIQVLQIDSFWALIMTVMDETTEIGPHQ